MDYQYSGEDEEVIPVIEQRGYVDNDQPNIHQVDEAVRRVLSDRQWIDETEYRYERARKHLRFSVLANCFLFLMIVGLSIGIATQSPSSSSSSNDSSSQAQDQPGNAPVAPPSPTVPRPTYGVTLPQPTQPKPTPPPPTNSPPKQPQPTNPSPTVNNNNNPAPTKPAVPNVGDLFSPTVAPEEELEYVTEFKDYIIPNTKRPLGDAGVIQATFGPQFRTDCQCYEFHRGLDLAAPPNTPIVATADGIVEKIINVGKKGIIIKHAFTTQVSLHPDKGDTDEWYSLYFHAVDWKVNEGDAVQGGQMLAFMTDEHLHYEIRVGTPCDYEDYVTNSDVTCNKLGYDPHVHPLLTYPLPNTQVNHSSKQNIQLSVHQDISPTTDAIVTVMTSVTNPNINRYRVGIVEVLDDVMFQRDDYVLDLNLRRGFDPTSLMTLNEPNKNFPYLDPQEFDADSDDHWKIHFVIPKEWVGSKKRTESFMITVTDIWGNMKILDFGFEIEINNNRA